jgi:hypothetical protein
MTEETTTQRLSRLRQEVVEKRQLEQIAELERELAGGTPASRTSLASDQGTSRKRPASEELSSVARRALPPPVYEGKSLRELRDFTQGCEVFFAAVLPDEDDEPMRIRLAASYLRGQALRQWSRRQTPSPATWDEFVAFLRNVIADPANRMSIASLRLKEARQGEGQSIREFASYIEELEEDLPLDMPVEEQRAWTLLNGLAHDLRTAVLREERVIRSREQVIAAAQRQHELQTLIGHGPSAKSAVGAKRGPVARETPAPGAHEKSGSSGSKATSTVEKTCYNCDKKGHLARDCPEPRKARGSRTGTASGT